MDLGNENSQYIKSFCLKLTMSKPYERFLEQSILNFYFLSNGKQQNIFPQTSSDIRPTQKD